MKDEPSRSLALPEIPSTAEQLARDTNKTADEAAEIYAAAKSELERTALIKTFIEVLATRRARIILDTDR
jgi:hypothetical protein